MPRLRARGAAVAVRRHHVGGAHRALLAAVQVAEHGRDAVGVLLQRRHLGAVAQLGPELESLLAEERLEDVLVEEQPRRRREALDALVEVRDVDGVLLAGERLDGVDPTARVVHGERRLACALLQPDLAQDLHRPNLEVPGARVDRGAGVALDGQRLDAVAGEQQGGRQPDEAAADDQDRGLLLHGRGR